MSCKQFDRLLSLVWNESRARAKKYLKRIGIAPDDIATVIDIAENSFKHNLLVVGHNN